MAVGDGAAAAVTGVDQALIFVAGTVIQAGYPIEMRYAGPREALLHAVFRQNFGCSHLVVGRDHAGPGLDSKGDPFYGPYDAQDLVQRFSEELGVAVVPFKEFVYLPEEDSYEEVSKVTPDTKIALGFSSPHFIMISPGTLHDVPTALENVIRYLDSFLTPNV